jgi:hypothetical protein
MIPESIKQNILSEGKQHYWDEICESLPDLILDNKEKRHTILCNIYANARLSGYSLRDEEVAALEKIKNDFSHDEYQHHYHCPVSIANAALAKVGDDGRKNRPNIVCLCGSTRFGAAFQEATLKETLAGNIVLSIGCNMKSDSEIFGHLPEDELRKIKECLDELHKRKIDMADEILVLNVGGYIGESTRNEINYALSIGKPVVYLEKQEEEKQKE